MPSALEAQSLNQWITREVPDFIIIVDLQNCFADSKYFASHSVAYFVLFFSPIPTFVWWKETWFWLLKSKPMPIHFLFILAIKLFTVSESCPGSLVSTAGFKSEGKCLCDSAV